MGIDSDRLFPVRLQQEIVDLTPGADRLHLLLSPYGHDGFLVEDEQVGVFVAHALHRVRRSDAALAVHRRPGPEQQGLKST